MAGGFVQYDRLMGKCTLSRCLGQFEYKVWRLFKKYRILRIIRLNLKEAKCSRFYPVSPK